MCDSENESHFCRCGFFHEGGGVIEFVEIKLPFLSSFNS